MTTETTLEEMKCEEARMLKEAQDSLRELGAIVGIATQNVTTIDLVHVAMVLHEHYLTMGKLSCELVDLRERIAACPKPRKRHLRAVPPG